MIDPSGYFLVRFIHVPFHLNNCTPAHLCASPKQNVHDASGQQSSHFVTQGPKPTCWDLQTFVPLQLNKLSGLLDDKLCLLTLLLVILLSLCNVCHVIQVKICDWIFIISKVFCKRDTFLPFGNACY